MRGKPRLSRAPAGKRVCRRFVAWLGGLILTLVPAAAPQSAQAGSLSEPHTVFYGKVIGTGSARPFAITDGSLVWTLLRADGVIVTLRTSLFAYGDDAFSYRLEVPHSAFALGLDENSGGIPLPPLPQTHWHAEIRVDGQVATLLGPASGAFTTEQLLRAATYRMDLALERTAPDSDGDGMADWWEDLHGLDKQDPADAGFDANGDGVTALQAYLRGLDPHRDARQPQILTDETTVYPVGVTALVLDTADLDSAPEQLVYTLTRLPLAGELTLRNAQPDPSDPDVRLTVGSSFTQADLLSGRVVYEHDGSQNEPGLLAIEVRDQNPDHPPFAASVRLLPYVPGATVPEVLSEREAHRLQMHRWAQSGRVALDASALPRGTRVSAPSAGLAGAERTLYVDDYGDDLPYALRVPDGGYGEGGQADDVLIAHAGEAVLSGGPGADRWALQAFAAGRVVASDFSVDEGDTLDLSALPAEPGADVGRYLRLAAGAEGYELQTDLAGSAAVFSNVTVALPTLRPEQADLYDLIENGRLLVGALRLKPRITVGATLPIAARSGPTAGRFTLYRRGAADGALSVAIILSGTAVNGRDYVLTPTTVTLPAGVREQNVTIMPYADEGSGASRFVHLSVLPGSAYGVGSADSAMVTIEPLKAVVSIAAPMALAVRSNDESGWFRVEHRYVTGTDLSIDLRVAGTAVRNTDYELIPPLGANLLVNGGEGILLLTAQQSEALIEVRPLTGAAAASVTRTVDLTVEPNDSRYLRQDGAEWAQVAIIPRRDSLSAWRAREYGVETGDMAEFAQADSGSFGVNHWRRYAFGLDPLAPQREGLPRVIEHQGRVWVTFRKPLGATDVVYRLSAVTDLLDPANSAVSLVPVAAPDGSRDPERVYYRVEPDGLPRAFVTVEAQWTPAP
jgi:hypothetical protein